jgi:ubiquinone/menaquinone biosynthesis C-methylase UbiE
MTTDYDTIAQEYKKAKLQPWRRHIECFTLAELIGDVRGKAVLDLACGEGFYTRILARGGAARVVGVDLSQGMIDLANQQEKANPLGIEYHRQDALQLSLSERFDLVTASYLLNYASTREELLAMCRGIVGVLKPGGRLVAVNNNPAHAVEYFAEAEKYGFVKIAPDGLVEGAPVIYRIFLDGGSIDITNYHLSIATHEWAFRTAGFKNIAWHNPRLSPAGEQESGRDYWQAFLEHPPVVFIECRK